MLESGKRYKTLKNVSVLAKKKLFFLFYALIYKITTQSGLLGNVVNVHNGKLVVTQQNCYNRTVSNDVSAPICLSDFVNLGKRFLIHYFMINSFFFFYNLNSSYHTPLLYIIHLMSVERMLERFVTYEV